MKRTLKQVLCDGCTLLWSDIKDAKWAIILVIACFSYLKRFLYSMCPMVWLTGYPCPGCGMTRAAFCILHLDFFGAFKIHPFIYAVAGYVVIFFWNRYILLRKAGKKLKWLLLSLIVAMVIYYIWRMIRYFPGEPPMSYYYNNMFALMKRSLDCIKKHYVIE